MLDKLAEVKTWIWIGIALVALFYLMGVQLGQCLADGYSHTYCSALIRQQLTGGSVIIGGER